LHMGPIVLSCAATMFFGNVSYLYLSMAFIQVMVRRDPPAAVIHFHNPTLEVNTRALCVALVLSAAVLVLCSLEHDLI
jgi:hypothetical protein